MCCAQGALPSPLVPASEQRPAVLHPAAALWRALASGQVAAEYREVHPGCVCIAAPALLPSGGTVVASLARPEHREVESLKRPLEGVVSLIRAVKPAPRSARAVGHGVRHGRALPVSPPAPALKSL